MATTLSLHLSRKNLLAVLFSIFYAFFVLFFPWESISIAGFPDFKQTVKIFDLYSDNNINSFNEIYENPADSYDFYTLIKYFSQEVLWFKIMFWLKDLTGETAIALHIISFFILFIWGLFLFKNVNFFLALLFLFNPYSIDVAMSGIRNGLAWSLVILGLMTQSKVLKAAFFLTGIFIHSTTLVLAIIYYFTKNAKRLLKGRMLLLCGLGIGILAGVLLTVGSERILGAIEDRRRGEDYLVGGGSFTQASLWGILLCLQCLSSRNYIKKNIFVMAVLAWYLTMNPLIPWSYRVWSAFLPVIAASAMCLSCKKRQIFIFLYLGYLVMQILYWTKLFKYWH